MITSTKAMIFITVLSFASSSNAATTLLPGGDFEVDGGGSPYSGNVVITSGGSMPFWAVGGAGNIVNWPILDRTSGIRAPEMSNLRTVGLSASTTSISTEIATVIGNTYEVTFDHSILSVVGDSSITTTFDVAITGQANTSYSNVFSDFTLADGVPNSFHTESIQFTATATTTTLSLISTGENGVGDRGPTIDNVRFDVIPEPSSAALVGLASLGLMLRRRRSPTPPRGRFRSNLRA
ncbi:MAG: DUF642 domain-containing protein [Akkermansiaceae bacterium]